MAIEVKKELDMTKKNVKLKIEAAVCVHPEQIINGDLDEIQEAIEKLRSLGEAEIVDIDILE
jgi:hypothetical protein